MAIKPFKIESSITPEKLGVPYETIYFVTKDNVTLDGWFIKSNNPKAKTIILLHGYPADKGDIFPAMFFLHEHYNLFLFDFRYFGKSGGSYSTVGKDEVLDLQAAIAYLQTRGVNEVGVWGISMGGAVALMTAPQSPAIKAIVSESTYARLDLILRDYYRIPFLRYPLAQLTRLWAWLFLHVDIAQVSPALAAEKLQIPVLLIHSKGDTVVPFEHALLLEKSLSHNKDAQIIFVDENAHGESIKDYQTIIRKFFDESL